MHSHEITWFIAKESEAVKRNWLRSLAVSNSLLSLYPKISLNQCHNLALVNKDLDRLPLGIPQKRSSEWDFVRVGDIRHGFLPRDTSVQSYVTLLLSVVPFAREGEREITTDCTLLYRPAQPLSADLELVYRRV